ncbi:MAG TPA: hypothetical protein VNW99_08040 [Cytophagaceae bacterium]|jgi:hypothetical protein|nr:hypothetical protein [Cytophagaceae bacterium]
MRKFKIILQTPRICIYAVLMICLLSINSCKHNNFVGFEGPAQCVSANFAFTQAFNPPGTVDFSTDSVIFTAGFNEIVSWTITVTGQTSGATISFSGKSSNINTVWRGNPGSIAFFQLENVTVELKIPCRESTTKTINITGKPNFNNCGVLLSDFDGHGVAQTFNFYPGAGNTAPAGVMNSPLLSPQGGQYYHASGGNPPPVSWYYGEVGSSPFSLAKLGTTYPDSVYFNVLINSNGVSTGSINIMLRGNNNYSAIYKPDGSSGWKLLSLKVSDFKPLSPGPSANPMQVTSVTFDLGPSVNQGDPCEIDIDLVIFTKGHPFF